MSQYRHHLPQLDDRLFLTDGGLETTLVFHQGRDLPCFAAFTLLEDAAGTAILQDYYIRYLDIARQRGLGFVLETPTWRANPDWAARLGYDTAALAAANRRAVALLAQLRRDYETPATPLVISGNLGPRHDGYRADIRMSAAEARDYHRAQIGTFAATEADMVSVLTLNYTDEAIGIIRAARDCGMPVAVSFTVETDGRLPSGEPLNEAIQRTDAATESYAAYFMLNCAHPDHFAHALQDGEGWQQRLRGLRANASRRSHAELDECTELDAGDPLELGDQYRSLRLRLPALSVLGGCCGTDHRHVEAICAACG
ncbi:homocysteine S-methyltransferase family protein [Thiohalobacter thiocyanaticus]|uniref:Homocysteine S-methyltransferase n=1 Tax=Thiohalobacter thiocyanaticus TaxID=585455 RepID=A0A426QJP8_9GAMM|nr:homocysteine S-methyltransferase family protein [Thiohalobacter thiocyanaticus]RRQ21960.1 homocysteine S-methyltransferase [Thiohalobacter thiocyanaticus]